MELLLIIIIFLVSLAVLVKGADWFLVSAEKIGLALGLSPFIVGVTIVALGTSFPELFTSMVAVFRTATETIDPTWIISANVIGSNIANILLVVGISAVVGKKLVVTKSLIDVDLPLLAIGTVLLVAVIVPWGKDTTYQITMPEALILLITYGIYLVYTFMHKDEEDTPEVKEVLPTREQRRKHIVIKQTEQVIRPKINFKVFVYLGLGLLGLIIGSKYLIDSVIMFSEKFNIGVGVISILAVAVGTTLPEIFVSVKAALAGKSEVALGNIFGSNIFNSFVVIGLPALFKTVNVDETTFLIGLPVMTAATILFVFSGISRRIHNWEGLFYLAFYILFVGKIFNIF